MNRTRMEGTQLVERVCTFAALLSRQLRANSRVKGGVLEWIGQAGYRILLWWPLPYPQQRHVLLAILNQLYLDWVAVIK